MAGSNIDLAAHFTPEVIPGVTMFMAAKQERKLAVHDIESRRENMRNLFGVAISQLPDPVGISTTVYETTLADGHVLKLYWHHHTAPATPNGPAGGPAILHVHGGGYIGGDAEQLQKMQQTSALFFGIPILSVEYRKPPEFPHPYPVEDALAGLQWLHANAEKLGVDKSRIAAMGESAGGGLAACLALLARDRGVSPPLKLQLLVYPMLDDSNTKGWGDLEPTLMWDSTDNLTGWSALVGKDKVGTDAVSEYASPPRAKSLKGLPKTYIDVGSADLFIQEDIDYAARLTREGVKTEAHVYYGLPHGFEMLLGGTQTGASIMENRKKFLSQL